MRTFDRRILSHLNFLLTQMSLLNLQDKLAEVASVVDAVDKQFTKHFTINKDGEPVLKRIPLAQTNEVEELELKSVL